MSNVFVKCLNIPVNEINICCKNVILNSIHYKPEHIVNYITLIVKQFIFYCKCANKKPGIVEIMAKIESIYQIEKYNAKHDYTLMKRFKKWLPYDEYNVINMLISR